ncbi:hypothetical protein NDA13_000428 [Ustilago tritici]|nr:hypothetical protein NDA13_000428 [Ustilago tritici]
MSSEEHFDSDAHRSDEQLAIDQEREDEDRETSFLIQKETRDVEPSTSSQTAIGDAAAPDQLTGPTAAEQYTDTIEEEEAAAVEEATAIEETVASGSKPSRSARKSRASGPGVSAGDAKSEQARKRARKSVAGGASLSERTAATEADANVRLDRLRQALFRFLDLIEHRATRSSFAKAFPHIDEESVEALRQQFVSQLKDAIVDESEKLIESNELEAKLASLHRLTQEADARYQAGHEYGSEELKDVWRKNLDLETAISARAIPNQERRVQELKAELELVRKQNRAIHTEMLDTRARSLAIRSDAQDSLDALESAIRGLEATPDMQKQLRQTMDDLLQDLGARV